MDSVHDLGGTDGMGPIEPEEEEPYFHHDWEADVFGLLPVTMGQEMYNIDEFRHAIERMDPVHYLDSSYYEHWLSAMEMLLVKKGILTEDELQEKLTTVEAETEASVPEREDPELTEALLGLVESGASTKREPVEPTFDVGDRVEVKNIHPEGHTRCPEYVRRTQGEISEIRGTFVLPDTNAHGEGENAEPVYSVRFDNSELWGEEFADTNEQLYIDLWESYLEPI